MIRTVYEWLKMADITRWRFSWRSADKLRWARARRRRPMLEDRRVLPPKMRARLLVIKKLRAARRRVG